MTRTLRRKHLLSGAVMTGLVGLGWCLLASLFVDADRAAVSLEPSVVQTLPVVPETASSERDSRDEAAGSTVPQQTSAASLPIVEGWRRSFSSEQMYAEAIRLREAREPGSFAAAWALTRACRYAMGQVLAGKMIGPHRDPLVLGAQTPTHAQRLRARDALQSRCEAFSQHAGLDKPLQDDGPGQALYLAISEPQQYFLEPLARQNARLLAQQGHLQLYLGVLPYWNGRTMNSAKDRRLYQDALSLARELATASPQAPEQDVRLLTACFVQGFCTDDFIKLWRLRNPQDDEASRQVEVLALDMAAAMRAGDYGKFVR